MDASQKRTILRERARALARHPEAPQTPGSPLLVLTFEAGSDRYGLDIACVREVQPVQQLTPLPGVPAFVAGIVHLRGQMLGVVDLVRFFDLPVASEPLPRQIVVIVRVREAEFGVFADAVAGVQTLDAAELQPTPPTLAGIRGDVLRGITAAGLIVLDGRRLATHDRLVLPAAPPHRPGTAGGSRERA